MLQPEIKGYFSTDILDLATWKPASLASLHFGLDIFIGSPGGDAADQFQIVIATPEALRRDLETTRFISGRHYLIVSSYDWPEIQRYLEELVSKCAAPTWPEAATKLSRHFFWEYEDYVVHDDEDDD